MNKIAILADSSSIVIYYSLKNSTFAYSFA